MWSNNYIHIPFQEKGRAESGCDCWGLVRIVYQKELGILLPEFSGYDNTKDVKAISKMIHENTTEGKWSNVTIGTEVKFDVCVFKMIGVASHVGVVVDRGLMIHCQRGMGTVHSEYLKESIWSERLQGIYRYAEHPDSSVTI